MKCPDCGGRITTSDLDVEPAGRYCAALAVSCRSCGGVIDVIPDVGAIADVAENEARRRRIDP